MDNLDYLKEIREIEKKADEIIANARIQREEKEKEASARAEEIIAKATGDGEIEYRTALKEAMAEGDNILLKAVEEAQKEASLMEQKASLKLDEAIKNVVKGIVDICVDS